MIEWPAIQEWMALGGHKMILGFLKKRFGPIPAETLTELEAIQDVDRLEALAEWAAECPNLDAFRARLIQ